MSYNYVNRDLRFRRGDLIYLKKKLDENWYIGETAGRSGYLPATYVQVSNDGPSSVTFNWDDFFGHLLLSMGKSMKSLKVCVKIYMVGNTFFFLKSISFKERNVCPEPPRSPKSPQLTLRKRLCRHL